MYVRIEATRCNAKALERRVDNVKDPLYQSTDEHFHWKALLNTLSSGKPLDYPLFHNMLCRHVL
jgi:hypothetical protein